MLHFHRFHTFYWMGLRSSDRAWPAFHWIDFTPGPNTSTYRHWGWYLPSLDGPDRVPEPNNLLMPPEYCAGGNASQAFGNPAAWGWADYHCDEEAPFMCKIQAPLVASCSLQSTGNEYVLNTTATEYWAAQRVCNTKGGHLVAYRSVHMAPHLPAF